MEQIEKPWAVYGLTERFIGRVVEEWNGGAGIQYCEGQMYSPQLWASYAIERFETSKEAIEYVLSKSHEYSREQLTGRVLDDFPKATKMELFQINKSKYRPSDIEYLDEGPVLR